MAVVIETTLGDITVDLFLKQRPITCLNFLKLCKMKYYNFNLFHSIRSGFIAQTGDPTGEGSGGESIWGILEGPKKRFFSGEKMPRIRHTDAGLLSMVCTDDMMIGSQFFFTLAPDLDSLDSQHCVIGEVTEGHDILRKLNEVICDETHRPYRDVRITHTVVLEDPFNDPAELRAPSRSPSPNTERLRGGRIAPDEEVDETQGKSIAEVQEIIDEKEAKARATILEIIGDLPDADIAPPENVLFVCKLNPVTTDEDLEIIFSRFGKIVSCEVIRDKKTGDSLQYAFVEFSDKKSCEDAYFKMDNVLIDDRRIHVDFSQSVSKMRWLGKGRGVKHFTEEEIRQQKNADKNRAHSRDKDPSSRRDISNKDRHDDKRNSEKERHKSSREHRYSDRDRHSNKERDRHNDRERRNRNDTDAERKDRNNEHKSDRHRESNDTKKYDRDSKRENGKNTNDNNDVSQNISRNKEKDDSKIKSKDRQSPERNKRNNEHKSDRHREGNNTKKDDHREKRRHEERRNSERNEHINLQTDRDHKHYWHDAEMDFEAPSRPKERSKHRNNSITEDKEQRKYNNHESKREVRKKTNENNPVEPKTPSPSPIKNIKEKSNDKKAANKKLKVKDSAAKSKRKRRKSSSSSSSESDSESSSSSSSSSSDESEKKKKSKKKRKYTTSSSSSSSSESSSTTTSTSSDSSSDSEPKKKSSKKNRKKKIKNKKK